MSTIRVATYNLYLGADLTVVFDSADEVDLADRARVVLDQVVATDFVGRAEALARLLVRERVDVVGLQEVARWSRDVGSGPPEVWLDFLVELLSALSRTGAGYDVHACTENFRGGAEVAGATSMSVLGHNVVLVRRGSGIRVLAERTGDFTRTLDVVTPMPGLVLNVARSWGWLDAEVDGRPFRFVNTHLEAWDADVRAAQRDQLLLEIDDPGVPVVVVGDFNAEPAEVGMPEEYVDAWAVAGEGDGLTCGQAADLTGESSLGERIDYVFVRDARVERSWVVGHRDEDRAASGLWPSDHAGVVAEVTL
ncbi:MAG TPA: endonuclease/exonuclease/phosphatase family protein [Nocardioidaceae bacterium]